MSCSSFSLGFSQFLQFRPQQSSLPDSEAVTFRKVRQAGVLKENSTAILTVDTRKTFLSQFLRMNRPDSTASSCATGDSILAAEG